VRVLLDENLPHGLISALSGHEVLTVQGLGWAGVKNGELLRRASGEIDAFLTMDRLLGRQRDLTALPFGVVLIVARSNRIADMLPLVSELLEVLHRVRPGKVEQVGA
jgi:hypothetical protein